MPKKRFKAEQIVVLLRQIEVLMSQGKAAPVACREAGISQQSYHRWRKEYGGLEFDQAKRMKDLERENKQMLPGCRTSERVRRDPYPFLCGEITNYVGLIRGSGVVLCGASRPKTSRNFRH
jgi:hypothetical protein